ncbi:MAG: DEAD/DEAH box helicase, partial [Planctomycetes bacterium]|nr:DEAD/DEAH box helicase [Planctomycetota bacterium]
MGSVRRALPRTYSAFLGRFDRPSEIQVSGVPLVLAGGDVLLCAPTASGKTESYCAPAVESILSQRVLGQDPVPRLLLVSPTRALANDLHRRLQGAMDTLHVPLGRYTGEHKERKLGKLPEVMIVTPESLDSLLARRSEVLAGVRTVVVDEIHVLDGTSRGDQLRFLLHRLENVAETRPQRIGASATVADPEALAKRYLRDPEVCEAAGHRKLKAKSFKGTTPTAMASHLDVLAKAGLRKILIFVPSRKDVDELSMGLKGRSLFRDRIFAHHGSLSKSHREHTERSFHDAPAAVAVATMTLELGIDIGSVDYVILSSPPANVASLMQRIGRGGRRRDTIRFGYAWRDVGEEFRIKVMARAGAHGDLLQDGYGLRAGVIVQQAASLAGAFGHVTAKRLFSVVPEDLRETFPLEMCQAILDSMVQAEWLERPRSGRYVLTESIEARYEFGSLHSNLDGATGVEVIDRLTGDVVGKVRGESASQVAMGGAGRRVVQHQGDRILTDKGKGGEGAQYETKGSPLTSFALGRALAEGLGAGPKELLQVQQDGAIRLVHGLGTLGGLFLSALLVDEGMATGSGKPTPVSVALPRPIEYLPLVTPERMADFLKSYPAKLARLCGMGPYHGILPEEMRMESLEEVAGLQRIADFLNTATLREPDFADALPPAV